MRGVQVYNADDSKKWFRPQKTTHASYERKGESGQLPDLKFWACGMLKL